MSRFREQLYRMLADPTAYFDDQLQVRIHIDITYVPHFAWRTTLIIRREPVAGDPAVGGIGPEAAGGSGMVLAYRTACSHMLLPVSGIHLSTYTSLSFFFFFF